jgi:hypothetical protein
MGINPSERPIKPFDFVDLDDGKIVRTGGVSLRRDDEVRLFRVEFESLRPPKHRRHLSLAAGDADQDAGRARKGAGTFTVESAFEMEHGRSSGERSVVQIEAPIGAPDGFRKRIHRDMWSGCSATSGKIACATRWSLPMTD